MSTSSPSLQPLPGTETAVGRRREDAPTLDALPRELGGVRSGDLRPYAGLGYLSTLFRFLAVFLVVLFVAQAVIALIGQGSEALPDIVVQASRLVVLAGVLWGVGDLARLLVDIGHDVRAMRIMQVRHDAHGVEELRQGDRR